MAGANAEAVEKRYGFMSMPPASRDGKKGLRSLLRWATGGSSDWQKYLVRASQHFTYPDW